MAGILSQPQCIKQNEWLKSNSWSKIKPEPSSTNVLWHLFVVSCQTHVPVIPDVLPDWLDAIQLMMMSWHGNSFPITGSVWGESISDRGFTSQMASDTELWCFLCNVLKNFHDSSDICPMGFAYSMQICEISHISQFGPSIWCVRWFSWTLSLLNNCYCN